MSAGDRVTVLYDEDCGFCRWSSDRLRVWDRTERLRFVAIQSPEGGALLTAIPPRDHLDSMHAVTADGRVWSAGAAVAPILRRLPWGRPLATLAEVTPDLTEQAYRTVASRRTTLGRLLGAEACRVDPSRTP